MLTYFPKNAFEYKPWLAVALGKEKSGKACEANSRSPEDNGVPSTIPCHMCEHPTTHGRLNDSHLTPVTSFLTFFSHQHFSAQHYLPLHGKTIEPSSTNVNHYFIKLWQEGATSKSKLLLEYILISIFRSKSSFQDGGGSCCLCRMDPGNTQMLWTNH